MRALGEFLVGATVIVAPGLRLHVLAGTAAVAAGRALARRARRPRRARGDAPTAKDGGEQQRVTLEWEQLSVAITNSKTGQRRVVFEGLDGSARPGRLLAIMGSSGAGKTTLLNALAGQLPAGKGVEFRGRITANGAPASESRHSQAYVQQDDVFFSQLTVRETLTTAAQLRFGPAASAAEVQAAVGSLIQQMGLAKAADTRVGSAKQRGLSGGERKRLSIACELLGDPALLFCDEPTTGLDSFQAERVMQALKQLAGEGRTVAVAIHQPRSSVFALFDDLLLLSEGGLVYSGPAAAALEHFKQLGHACPPAYNPAEFVADLISVDHSSPEALRESTERVSQLRAAWTKRQQQQRSSSSSSAPAASEAPPAVGSNGAKRPVTAALPKGQRPAGSAPARWGLQWRVLLRRAWRQVSRDRATALARLMSNLSSAAIFGSIYWRLSARQDGVQNRLGLLQVAAINCAMSSVVKTLSVFSQERVIVQRERSRAAYAVGPYFGAKLAAESPVGAVFPLIFGAALYPAAGLHPRLARFVRFLGVLTLESFVSSSVGLAVGAVAPSPDAAQAIGPAVMVVFIVFGGTLSLPWSFLSEQGRRLLRHLSAARHALQSSACLAPWSDGAAAAFSPAVMVVLIVFRGALASALAAVALLLAARLLLAGRVRPRRAANSVPLTAAARASSNSKTVAKAGSRGGAQAACSGHAVHLLSRHSRAQQPPLPLAGGAKSC